MSVERRVLVATGDVLGEKMAGPGIRALNIATALAADHAVELVSTAAADLEVPGLRIQRVDADDLSSLEQWCDVMVVQGWVLHRHPRLMATSKVMVCDMYDPLHLEALEQARDQAPAERAATVKAATSVLNDQLRRGDYFVCASDRQRDFWLGHLAALGRVNPDTYDNDPTLRSLIDVAPFGIPTHPPKRQGPAIRSVVDGIGPDDQVLIWGGGLYNWLDPVTVIQAVDRARQRLPKLRLFFLGAGHPSPDVPRMRIAYEARALADRLGLTDKVVFFNDRWVEHARLGDYLLDATVGVSSHVDHLESSLSYRARILDYFWAGLPVVVTKGDVLAGLVEQRGLGRTVAAGDVDAFADAIVELVGNESAMAQCRANVGALVDELTWDKALAPLLRFCSDPRRASDWATSGTRTSDTAADGPVASAKHLLRSVRSAAAATFQARR